MFYSDDGYVCIGNWLNDCLEGKAMFFFLDGGFFFGDFSSNEINGLGFLRLANKDIIAGYYKGDNLHGYYTSFKYEEKSWVFNKYFEGNMIKCIHHERNVDESNYITKLLLIFCMKEQIPDSLSSYPELRDFILSVFSNTFLLNIMKNSKNNENKLKNFQSINILKINKDIEYFYVK